MSIYSKAKSKVKSAISKVKSVAKGIVSGAKNVTKKVVSTASTLGSKSLAAVGSLATPKKKSPVFEIAVGGGLSPADAQKARDRISAKYGGKTPQVDLNSLRFDNTPVRIGGGSSRGLTMLNSYGGSAPVPSPTKTIGAGQTSPTAAFTSPLARTSTMDRTSFDSISSESLASAPAVTLPSAPAYTDFGSINNAGLISELSQTQTYDPESGLFVPNTSTEQTEEERRKKDFQELMGLIPEKESVYDSREVKRQQKEVQQRQQEVNNYTAQLNSIVAKQNADLLNLRGIGAQEGVTETVYGGQAATINREAAIKALPIQAQLSAAQGNLELAQDYLDQIITIKRDQIDADFEYNMMKFKAIEGFLGKEEKIRLDKMTKAEERAYDQSQKNLDLQDDWARYAIENGQGYLVSRIHGLNIGSPTFREDLGRIVGGIQDLDAVKKMSDNAGGSIDLSDEDRRILAGGGFSAAEINSITSDVDQYGIDAVLEGLNQRQQDAIMRVYGGADDSKQFLTRDYFENLFTKDQLEDAASAAGFTSGGFLGAGVGKSGINDYLNYIEKSIASYRSAGYTDKEILEMMQ